MIKEKTKKYKCPCCGYYTLNSVGNYEICPVCYLKDDLTIDKTILNKAIENYIKFKASDKQYEKNVRFPLLSETDYYEDYKDEESICNVLYSGEKEKILQIIKDLEIDYSFYKNIGENSININKIGILMKGKGRINPNYNCIKYFGYRCSYKKFIKKCPNCSKNLVDILYGDPTKKDSEKAERKELFLGECTKLMGLEQSKYHCYNCNRSYYEDLKNYEQFKNS